MHSEQSAEAGTASRTTHRIEKPFISAADVPQSAGPAIQIPKNRFGPLEELGTRRAFHETERQRYVRGTLAEWAAARYLGRPDSVNTEIYDDRGDDGYDLHVRGYKIEVKSARKEATSPRLTVGTGRELTADFYMLVHQLGRSCYRPVGWAPVHWVRNARTTTVNTGHQPRRVRVLEQDELLPFPTHTTLG